ncbi:unnamed protein product, partial [Brenthis ino]
MALGPNKTMQPTCFQLQPQQLADDNFNIHILFCQYKQELALYSKQQMFIATYQCSTDKLITPHCPALPALPRPQAGPARAPRRVASLPVAIYLYIIQTSPRTLYTFLYI